MTDHTLVARIKRGSKYWGQTCPNAWFEVRLVSDTHYQLRGNNNNYRVVDVAFGARFADGTVIDLGNGKVTRPQKPVTAQTLNQNAFA